MTPTELIAEARGLDRMATPGPWVYNVTELSIDRQGENLAVAYAITDGQGYPMVSVHDNDAAFITRSRTLIPALYDALEQAQATLEQTWEWDMYKCAQREIERMRKELEQAQNAQRWIPVAERLPDEWQNENGEPLEFNVMLRGAKEATTLCFNGSQWFEFDWSNGRVAGYFTVTHWMPIPQPPKGED